MADVFNLDEHELPQVSVSFSGQVYDYDPADFTRDVEELMKDKPETVLNLASAVRKVSGIKDLPDKKAMLLWTRMREHFVEIADGKKKPVSVPNSPGSTASGSRKRKGSRAKRR